MPKSVLKRGPRTIIPLLRLRGERLERTFAHLYETGGMRRVHLRGHANIRKRLLVHAGGFNLGLLMRQLIGVGTPRGLQDRVVAAMAIRRALINLLWALVTDHRRLGTTRFIRHAWIDCHIRRRTRRRRQMAFTTDC